MNTPYEELLESAYHEFYDMYLADGCPIAIAKDRAWDSARERLEEME